MTTQLIHLTTQIQRWLDQHFPDRASRVMARVREMLGLRQPS